MVATTSTNNMTTTTTSSTTNNNNNSNNNNQQIIMSTSIIDQSLVDDELDQMSDTDSEPTYCDSNDLMAATMEDEVTAQLAAAGPIGMAAAAAIASAKKRKRPHQFETNPSIRKRQQTRLLRKLRQTIDEFTIRVGMQAVILVTIPGKTQNSYKCFGAKPLEDVIRNLRPVVMQDLESALAQHAPVLAPEDPSLHELPPLVIDGIPTPVEKMTQAQLRAFIPLMLKFSTGRGKPGWGKESTRPQWWPEDLPWANVRMDARTEDEKQKVSWTHALRQIVINCYKYHGREDLLPVFSGDPTNEAEDQKPTIKLQKASTVHHHNTQSNSTSTIQQTTTQTQIIPTQTQATTSDKMYQICEFLKASAGNEKGQFSTHPTTVLQTISNPDGTVSIIQVDPTNSIITLPDGTTAQVQGVATLGTGQSEDGSGGADSQQPITVDISQLSHLQNSEGQIIITGEDGHAYPVTVSGMITVPMNSVYGNVVSIGQGTTTEQMQTKYVQANKRKGPRAKASKGNTPEVAMIATTAASAATSGPPQLVLPKIEPAEETTAIPASVITGDPTQTQLLTVNANGQVIHDNKVYQLCEYYQKSDNDGPPEKVLMMTAIGTTQSQSQQQSEETSMEISEEHELVEEQQEKESAES